ncbi:MAG: hypothetical protein M1834_002475 [Cirrosporium novae-zelandiae]|nr:MAG: hypothetical protein M1834_002475 [Cirrosporium novae-zelandiae]
MVLDPSSAIGLASAVVQFVDFSTKILSKGRVIYKNGEGALVEHLELEAIAQNVIKLNSDVKCYGSVSNIGTSPTPDRQDTRKLVEGCNDVSKELLSVLDNIKPIGATEVIPTTNCNEYLDVNKEESIKRERKRRNEATQIKLEILSAIKRSEWRAANKDNIANFLNKAIGH